MRQLLPAELAAWLADERRDKPLLLDVREPWEYARARIEGSVLIPMREVPARLQELPRDREIVAICHHGSRSQHVAMFLEGNGFDKEKLHNLVGGVDGWSRSIDPSVPLY